VVECQVVCFNGAVDHRRRRDLHARRRQS